MSDPRFFRKYLDMLDEQDPPATTTTPTTTPTTTAAPTTTPTTTAAPTTPTATAPAPTTTIAPTTTAPAPGQTQSADKDYSEFVNADRAMRMHNAGTYSGERQPGIVPMWQKKDDEMQASLANRMTQVAGSPQRYQQFQQRQAADDAMAQRMAGKIKPN